ncbi:IS5 family transposase [Aureimonas sp. N4]|uniref:IS5 family transposase n=1 Tax=Aureimonas sp. N4 TaxID=1638165 RepID=UPI00244EDAAD|nr:IS5 family transposase [Aureimonas sp. N4]
MRDLFWLSDEAWAKLEPHLPKNQLGKPRVDDRRVISSILHILKTGGRWRDVPPEYGPAKTIYNRYTRWARRGVWQRIFAKVAAAGAVPDELCLDSTHVKAHRSASGGVRRISKTSSGCLARRTGSSAKRSASRAAAERQKSIVWLMLVAGSSPLP